MLLSRFGKLESVEKTAKECLGSMVPEQTMRCAGPYLCWSTLCACWMLDRAEVTVAVNSLNLFTCVSSVHVNAVFFLGCIHPVRLQCDILEIYGYFLRMRTNTCAVCTTWYSSKV